MKTWFTSDPHYWHKNVINYCQRPFSDVVEMNEALIANYNALVSDEDIVYFLGDICFSGITKAKAIVQRLKGQKHLIMGNHDRGLKPAKWLECGFLYAGREDITWNGMHLSHFPYRKHNHDERVFPEQLEDDGNWLLHGHVHQFWKVKDKMINVGVDQWDYKPVSEEQIMQIIKEKE